MTTTKLAPAALPATQPRGTVVAGKGDRPANARDQRDGRLVNPATKADPDPAAERRRAQRLEIRLPVEFRQCREDGDCIVRTVTHNVSAGGLYLELDRPDFKPGDCVEAELSIPAAEGVSPYPGRAAAQVEILRVTPLDDRRVRRTSPRWGAAHSRYGLAARFLEPLRFSY